MSSDTAAVICTWNKREDVLSCLDSLQRVTGPAFDIVVVDNASQDGTAEAVRAQFAAACLVVNPTNLGGAGGFNAGLRHVLQNRGIRYAWLLDNDVVVDPEALVALREALQSDPRRAVAGSLILRRDAPTVVQELGATIDFETFETRPRFRDYPVSTMPSETEEVDYVPACSLLADLEKVRRVGVMDEQYFLYGDDIDWCSRFTRAGYRVVTAPASRVWHREGGRNRTSNLPVYYSWRNMCHFFLTSVAGTPRVSIFLDVFLRRAFVAAFLARRAGRSNSAATIITAVWDAVTGVRGRAAPDRGRPLDPAPLARHAGRFRPRLAFLCDDLDFYTAVRPLLDLAHPASTCDFFTSLDATRLPAWLAERVRLRPEEEWPSVSSDTTLVVMSRHVITAPHPREARWHEAFRNKGGDVCFFDQHSNLAWGEPELRALRTSIDSEWQWCREWFGPLLVERAARLATPGEASA